MFALERKPRPPEGRSATPAPTARAAGPAPVNAVWARLAMSATGGAGPVDEGAALPEPAAPGRASAPALLQRKCARCEEEETEAGGAAVLHRKGAEDAGPYAPGIVEEVLRGEPGQPLAEETRAFFEPRLGRGLGDVRIHTGSRAEQSARSVGAQAYSVGTHVVFDRGRHAPGTEGGLQLLAHELAHVAQQPSTRSVPSGRIPVGDPASPAERDADRTAEAVTRPSAGRAASPRAAAGAAAPTLRRRVDPSAQAWQPAPLQTAATAPASPLSNPAAPSPPQPRQRGPNPAACITPLVAALRAEPTASMDPVARSRTFFAEIMTCLRAAAPASNARFSTEILANLQTGFDREVEYMALWWQQMPHPTASDRREGREQIAGAALVRQAEAETSFRYDVVFEVDAPVTASWANTLAEWADVDGALAAIPDEYLWNRPTGILRLHRTGFAPAGLAPPGGQVGGSTESANLVNIYNAGATPFARSAGIRNMPGYAQGLRHEFGHLVQDYMRPGVTAGLWQLMGWTTFAWYWAFTNWQTAGVSNPATCPAPGLQNERCTICDAAGFTTPTGRDWAALDTFLRGLTATPVARNDRVWSHEPNGNFVNAWNVGAVPTGAAWSYAATGQGDYFSELFAFSVSDPEYVHTTVPANQVEWLKQNIFNTQAEIQSAMRDLTPAHRDSSIADRFNAQAPALVARLFTRQQIRAALGQLAGSVMQQSTPNQA